MNKTECQAHRILVANRWRMACYGLAFIALLFSLAACKAVRTVGVGEIVEDRVMREQADAFLAKMEPGLQQRQTRAIREALAGDHSGLEAVRNARNAQPKIADNVRVTMLTATLRLYAPKGKEDERLPLLIYLHGGGWTFGSLNSCGRFCNAMAATGRMKVLAVDYRLAPEHPYPQGLDDCVAAVAYARDHAAQLGVLPDRISLGGDSSGGNLALAAALTPACRGVLESLVVFYPVTKAFADGSDSWQRYGAGYGLDADIMDAFNDAYTQGGDARQHDISVGLCDEATLGQLPRTLLVAAGRDVLRDQGLEFARKAGPRVKRIEYKEAVHLFITVPGQDAAFHRAVADAAAFIVQ